MRSRVASSVAVLSFGLFAAGLMAAPASAEDPFAEAGVLAEDDLGTLRAASFHSDEPNITNNIVNNNTNQNTGDSSATDGSSSVIGNQNETASASDNSAAANNGDATVVNADGSEDFVAGSDNTVGMAESNGSIDLAGATIGDMTSGSISEVQIQDARGITNVWSNTGMFNNMINSTVVNVNFN